MIEKLSYTHIEQFLGIATGVGEVIALLKALDSPMTRKGLQEKLGLKGQANFRERYLDPALSEQLIEMTQPDSPKSPTQKYRLTDKGRQLLENE